MHILYLRNSIFESFIAWNMFIRREVSFNCNGFNWNGLLKIITMIICLVNGGCLCFWLVYLSILWLEKYLRYFILQNTSIIILVSWPIVPSMEGSKALFSLYQGYVLYHPLIYLFMKSHVNMCIKKYNKEFLKVNIFNKSKKPSIFKHISNPIIVIIIWYYC